MRCPDSIFTDTDVGLRLLRGHLPFTMGGVQEGHDGPGHSFYHTVRIAV